MPELLTATELNAGESSRASHVWRVDGSEGTEIYRRSWWTTPEVSAFMLGLNRLFGVDPRDLQATADTYRFWRELNVWAVPEVLGITEFKGAPALRVEFMAGETQQFDDLDATELGRRVALTHRYEAAHFGDVLGQQQRPLSEFYARACEMVREVAPKYKPANWQPHWDEVVAAFRSAPAPSVAVPMLLDWNGTQFIWRDGQPFALVDVEASALAPLELDLCFWELLLNGEQVGQFAAGYTKIRPLPDLKAHRTACRLILLALESEGSPPLMKWLHLSPHFDDAIPYLRLGTGDVKIDFRPLTPADVPLLTHWLQQPHVRAFWDDGERDEAAVMAHYFDEEGDMEQLLFFLNGVPVGFLQCGRVSDDHECAHLRSPEGETWAMDILIGEVNQTGLGIGAQVIRAFMAWWQAQHPGIRRWLIDPSPRNTRAIRAYAKAGFTFLSPLVVDGEEFQIMSLDWP